MTSESDNVKIPEKQEATFTAKDILTKDDIARLVGCEIHPVGSRLIKGGFTDDSDYDFLVISKNPIPHILEGKMGFNIELGGSHYEPAEGVFNSYRRRNVNIVLTYDKDFGRRFLNAQRLAQFLCLKSRVERVALFKAVLYQEFLSLQGGQSE